MFLIDKLYKDNPNYTTNDTENYIDKFLFYRKENDDIDIDVCETNIDNYKLTNPLINKDAKKVQQNVFNKSHKKFELIDNGQIYRGDTLINCMQVLLQIVNYDNEDTLITSSNFDEIKNGIKNSSILNNNPKLYKLLNEFVKKCYCEGNFFAIPYIEGYSLNQAKGKLKHQGYTNPFVDSSDTFFKVTYNYFVNGKSSCQLTKFIDEKYDILKKNYCNNWNLFIEHNYFQDFVNLDGTPKYLWNKTDKGFAFDLENYLTNAISALSNREKRIIDYKNNINK